MKQIALKFISSLIILFPLFSSAYNAGDFGSYSSLGPGAVTWQAGNCWATWNGASWVATLSYPASNNDVYILSGYTMTLDGQGYANNLTVETGAQLYVNGTTNNYVDVSANINCNGTIGNSVTTTYDGISFDIVNTSIISGSGSFSGSHLRGLAGAGSVATLTISMNVTLCFGPTSGTLTKNTSIYDHITNTNTFNLTFGAGTTTNLIPYTGVGACNTNLSIAGSDGTQTNRSGTYTINGTVIVSGYTVLATAGTAGYSANWIINNGGLLETNDVITSVTGGGSGAGGSTLTINSGGKMQITGTPFTSTFSLVNNVYNLNTGSTVEYDASGGQNVDNNLTYANLTLSTSGTKTASGTLNINGNLTINSPTVLVPNTAINVGGNWTDYSAAGFTETGSTVNFNGSGNQTLTVPLGESFVNVNMNKTSGYLILDSTSKSKMTISSPGILTLDSGIIVADTSNTGINVVFIGNGASVTGANNRSFVNGRVERSGNTTFTFPVGKGSEYRPIAISGLSGIFVIYGQYFDVSPDNAYVPTDYPTNQVIPSSDSVSRCEYWTLETTSNASATVTLSWDTYSCGVTNPATLLVARDSTSTSDWTSLGNGGTTGTVTQGTISTSSTVSFYSGKTEAYTLSTSDSFPNNPLPVSLLSFAGQLDQNDVQLLWITTSETNNAYFVIERASSSATLEGGELQFAPAGSVKGAGTSTIERNYQYTDINPFHGENEVLYYRLKQTDYDGHYVYSNIIAVNYSQSLSNMIKLFPNPASDNVYISITWEKLLKAGISTKAYMLSVFDMEGREVLPQQFINFSYGMLQSIDVSPLPKGAYIIQLNSDSDVQRTDLVKD